jgi:hypothetical protein
MAVTGSGYVAGLTFVSAGRAVEALVLSILDGHHALYKVGRRLDERGMLALLGYPFNAGQLEDGHRDLKCRKARPRLLRIQKPEVLMLQGVPP